MGAITSAEPATNRHGVHYRDLWEATQENAGRLQKAAATALGQWLLAHELRRNGKRVEADEQEAIAVRVTACVLG